VLVLVQHGYFSFFSFVFSLPGGVVDSQRTIHASRYFITESVKDILLCCSGALISHGCPGGVNIPGLVSGSAVTIVRSLTN